MTIPYARALAELVPVTAVRTRRDFRQLLACITAVALLHQRQRDNNDGEIVASIDDYAIVRDLLAPIFDSVASDGCTPAVREIVEAVVDGEEVATTELATRLGLSQSTISYRTTWATQGGWLENAETRRGHQARWRRGGPLPESTTALPTPQRVTDLFECSNGIRETLSPVPLMTRDRLRRSALMAPPVDRVFSPAVRVLRAPEREGCAGRVVNGQRHVSPRKRLTTGPETAWRCWRDDLIILVPIGDEGIHARRVRCRRQLDVAGPTGIPTVLVCPHVPWRGDRVVAVATRMRQGAMVDAGVVRGRGVWCVGVSSPAHVVLHLRGCGEASGTDE